MGILIDVAELATAINVVLLAVLTSVWARNYLRFRSKHTLGLTVFAALLLAENALGLYFYVWDPTMHAWWQNRAMVPEEAMMATMLLDVLELGGVVFLAWVTWD